jgi:predicted nucleotidyltransferase component of viral defense system
MIRKQDILDRAAEWQLRPEVVEKDYVLGWLLAGVAELPVREQWIFKGGTCIKKCYFETYRFSEDLDFSLQPDAAYTEDALVQTLRGLTARVGELSGLEFTPDHVEVRARRNLQGQPTFEGRVAYRGPLLYPGSPKILFDLTQYERVLEPPCARAVLHPYPDELPAETTVLAYSFNELLAEKTRALFERSRPRDLYDLIHLVENAPDGFDLGIVRDLFHRKCRSKNLIPPSRTEMIGRVTSNPEMRSEWANMLAHQLPALPDLDGMLAKLPALLRWLEMPAAVPPELRLPPVPAAAVPGTLPVGAPGIQFWGSGLPFETIRFAGTNRLLLEFDYHGQHRRVEPYSIRQAETTGNLLFYGWEEAAGHIKAYKVAEMQNVHPTGISFMPRYRLEFAPGASVTAAPTAYPVRTVSPRTARISSYGPKYIFECPTCQKRFTHSSNNPELRKHRGTDGYWDCPGRRGYLVEVR